MKKYYELILLVIVSFFRYLPIIILKGLAACAIIGFVIEITGNDFSSYLSSGNLLNIQLIILVAGSVIHFTQKMYSR
jgi:hypothetical protein